LAAFFSNHPFGTYLISDSNTSSQTHWADLFKAYASMFHTILWKTKTVYY